MTRTPAQASRSKKKLGELLIDAGLISDAHIKAALHEQKKWGGRLGKTLVEMGFVTEASMCDVLAQQLELGAIDLDTAQLPARIESQLRLDLAERYGVFPVAYDPVGKQLALATSDPTNLDSMQEIEFATGARIVPVVATASSIDRAIRRYYFGEKSNARPALSPPAMQSDTTFELDQLLSGGPPAPSSPVSVDTEERLRQEVVQLHEHVERLEQIVHGQARALKTLVDVLAEYGLLTREDYLGRLSKPE